MLRNRLLAPLILLSLVTACASDPTVYPSLAPRPVEKLGFDEPTPPPAPPSGPDASLDSALATNAQQRAEAARDFDRAAARTETLVRAARGARVGSDAWISAQTAIADLDALRSRYGDSIDALNELARTRAATLQPAYPPLDQAVAGARAVTRAQTERIDTLSAELPGA